MAQGQIVIEGVSHRYCPPSGRPVLALEEVSLEVGTREFVALLGPLDAQTRSLMQTELLGIWQRSRKTVLFVTHDVQEAVYLAERVAVMSARPGRIKAIVDTRFDKNDPNIFKAKAFVDKVDEIWNLVRIEAVKAQGGRA